MVEVVKLCRPHSQSHSCNEERLPIWLGIVCSLSAIALITLLGKGGKPTARYLMGPVDYIFLSILTALL